MELSKRLLSGAAAGVIALMATATAASAEEIKLWTLTFANDSANKAWQKVVNDYEAANPGTTIRIENRGTDEHKAAMRVAAGSDQGPDIYFMWAGLGLGGEFVKAGLSLPLDKYYQQYGWSDRFLPSAAAFADLYPGGKHGVPSSFKGEAIYYNKKLFEQAGITAEPTTYDELLAAAEKLKAAGTPAITFGGTVNWHLMRLMDVLLETKCGAEKHDALMAMTTDWTKEACATDAFAELGKWTSNYTLSPFMGIDQAQSFNLFIAGRAAMMLEGDWLVQQISENGNLDDYGIFPFPTGTNRLYGFAEYNYISTKSPNPDAAAKFLDYFTSTPVQQAVLGAISTTSVNKDVKYENPRPLDAEWQEIFKKYSTVYMNGDQAFPLDVTTEYFRVINDVASGNIDAPTAVQQMQSFVAKRS
jgi:raffinose/stachyose/melibiose transport system substrate-binding protein